MQTWSIDDYSEGLLDRADDNVIPANASPDCQNWFSVELGKMRKRRGQAHLNSSALPAAIQGLFAYYPTSTTRKIIAASNGIAYVWNSSTEAFHSIKTGLSTTQPIMFEACINYLVGMDGTNAPWKYDGTTVTALANAPAKGKLPVMYMEKLMCVDPDTDLSTIVMSDDFDPETWPGASYWEFAKGDGDIITNIKVYQNQLFVFKRRSSHKLVGIDMSDFHYYLVDERVGCVGPNAADIGGSYLYFVADDGLYAFNGMTAYNISRDRIPISWEGINKQYLHKATVTSWNGMILFSLPEGDSTYNNVVLLYVPPAEGAVGGKFWRWRGISASCFMQYNTGSAVHLYSGNSNAGYIDRQDYGTDDFGEKILAYWDGPAFDGTVPMGYKRFRNAFIVHSPDTVDKVNLLMSIDYGAFMPVSMYQEDNHITQYRFEPGNNKARYMTPRFVHDGKGPCEIRGFSCPYELTARLMK